MTSSPHGLYRLGYTRTTMAVTMGRNGSEPELIPKSRLSSDCTLQLECMKLESLVIANQQVAVNTFPGLVHTARQAMEVGFTLSRCANPQGMQPTTVGSMTGAKS